MNKIILNLVKNQKFKSSSLYRLLSTENNNDMSKKSYWDKFYSKHSNEPFEWLIEFNDSLKTLASSITTLNNGKKVTLLLDIGCGTSEFSHKFKKTLPQSFLICSDFSYEALDFIKSNRQNQTSDFVQCNCKYLPFRDRVFDLIIDKGFSDSLLKESDVNKSLQTTIDSIKNQMDKLYKNGVIVQITDEEPELRISSLYDKMNIINYSFKEIQLQSGMTYYAYFIHN